MTYQGARSCPADSETHRLFSVSKIRLDAQGFATFVLWTEIDARTNHDVAEATVVPVEDVVDALHDGAQVRVVLAPPHIPLQLQTLEAVCTADGRHTVAIAQRVGPAGAPTPSLHDIATLDSRAKPRKSLSRYSSRRRARSVFAVSKVGLDADGRVTHVQWGRVDTATNLWLGTESVAPVADAVAAVLAGDQVFALFASADGYLPGRQFASVDYDDGRQTIALHGAPKAGHEIHDMDRLTVTVPS